MLSLFVISNKPIFEETRTLDTLRDVFPFYLSTARQRSLSNHRLYQKKLSEVQLSDGHVVNETGKLFKILRHLTVAKHGKTVAQKPLFCGLRRKLISLMMTMLSVKSRGIFFYFSWWF